MGWEREGREGFTCMTSLVGGDESGREGREVLTCMTSLVGGDGGDGLGERRKRGAHLYDFPGGREWRGWVGREKEERGSPV